MMTALLKWRWNQNKNSNKHIVNQLEKNPKHFAARYPNNFADANVQLAISSPRWRLGSLEIASVNSPWWLAVNSLWRANPHPTANSGARQHLKLQFLDSRYACISAGVRRFDRFLLLSSADGSGTLTMPNPSSCSCDSCVEIWGPIGTWHGQPSHHEPMTSASCASRQMIRIKTQSKFDPISEFNRWRCALEPSSARRNGFETSTQPRRKAEELQVSRMSFSNGRTWETWLQFCTRVRYNLRSNICDRARTNPCSTCWHVHRSYYS